jgi:TonB family protein
MFRPIDHRAQHRKEPGVGELNRLIIPFFLYTPDYFSFVNTALSASHPQFEDTRALITDELAPGPLYAARVLRAPQRAVTRPLVLGTAVVAVLAAHIVGVLFLVHSTRAAPAGVSDTWVNAFILPTIRDRVGRAPPDLPLRAIQLELHPADLHIELPQPDVDLERNNAAASAAPTLTGLTYTDMSPYVREAALRPGQGVTVVLRVEVLEDGTAGRIEVATSGGSPQIDQAAIHYARTRHWNAARVNGLAHALWIRFGVRLQG